MAPQPPLRSLENKSESTSNGLPTRTTSSASRKRTEQDSLQAFQILHTQFFGCLAPSFQTTLKRWRVGRPHSQELFARKCGCHACQGRDHTVRIRSGENVLVVINVHSVPDLILRDLLGRLRRIVFHWPRYPEGYGALFRTFFPTCSGHCATKHYKEGYRRRWYATQSRIERAFINVPITEARDFHCHSHVTDNLAVLTK